MELFHSKALVVGMGRSGFESACFLKERGASVTISEMASENNLEASARKLRQMGVQVELGGHAVDSFTHADVIIISPGVPHTIPAIRAAREKGIPVLGEIELASRFITQPIIAVTGTNGKTTTTRLIGDMMTQSGKTVFVGGNIGTPLISYLSGHAKTDWLVVEISSFQLDTVNTFKPDISLLLNISDDHLDRYANFEAYARSKGRIFKNQDAHDVAVLNGEDHWIRRISKAAPATKCYFTGRGETEIGTDVEPHAITFHGVDKLGRIANNRADADALKGENRAVLSLAGIPLKCRHELENISAAALATLLCGGTLVGIHKALETFIPLPHRMELVASIDGITFYNDSKATNVDAVLRAIECLPGPMHLIMGGRDKGGAFDLLESSVRQKVKSLILLGEAAKTIETSLGDITPTRTVASMKDAVAVAFENASSGEVVLLSPACTSFDMYQDYQERGRVFCKAVNERSPR